MAFDPSDLSSGAEEAFTGEDVLSSEDVSSRTNGAVPQGDLQSTLIQTFQRDPLRILGPDLFAETAKGLFRQRMIRDEVANRGSILIELEGRMVFFYRDPRARAQHIFESLMGLTYPCSLGPLEKRELYRRFDGGWQSGDLEYLAGVPGKDLEHPCMAERHRERLRDYVQRQQMMYG